MAKPSTVVSATIVAFFIVAFASALPTPKAYASPVPEIPEGHDDDAPPEVTRPPDENMSIAPGPKVDADHMPPAEAHYYPYRQQLTFRTGLASDFPKITMNDSVLGFEYLFPKFLSPKLEAGADLHDDGRGHIHIGTRWIAWERSYWRPSLKLALDHYMDSKVGLATLARKEDWYARGGMCAEYVVWNPYSIRAEAEMLANFDNVRLVLTVGLSRGW